MSSHRPTTRIQGWRGGAAAVAFVLALASASAAAADDGRPKGGGGKHGEVTIHVRLHLDPTKEDGEERSVSLREGWVTVPKRADGFGILDGALRAGLIDSYTTENGFLRCIEQMCAQRVSVGFAALATYWFVYENSGWHYLLDDVSADEGDRFTFAFGNPEVLV